MESLDQGHDNDRFENVVDEHLHCPICLKIFKEPVQCQRNDHHFCTPCITRHLENFQTCPSCREVLSLETLRKPSRFLMRNLSKLVIRCEYVNRGCDELVQLDDLKSHVMNCDYGSVVACSNDGCSVVITERDKEHHETEGCAFRSVKGADYDAVRKERDEMRMRLEEIKDDMCRMMAGIAEDSKKPIHSQVDCSTNKDIIIAGGREVSFLQTFILPGLATMVRNWTSGKRDSSRLNSVELFSWSKRSWEQLEPMRECRSGGASVLYKGQMVVTGGHNDETCFDSIEAMKMYQEGADWFDFPAMLANKCSGHQSVIYKDRLLVIGGIDGYGAVSDGIYGVDLISPYTIRLISRMPQPRCYHGAALIGDKILIAGGTTTDNQEDSLNSVVMYDLNKKEFTQMPPLPFAVSEMATVRWGENLILIGGFKAYQEHGDMHCEVVNTVIRYFKTGKSSMMPSMKYSRAGCAAVFTGHSIVVMGGYNKAQGYLNSVECYDFDHWPWKELPPMNEVRYCATAVAKSAV